MCVGVCVCTYVCIIYIAVSTLRTLTPPWVWVRERWGVHMMDIDTSKYWDPAPPQCSQFIAAMESAQMHIGLEQVLTPAALKKLLSKHGVKERLLDYLPEGRKTEVCALLCPSPSASLCMTHAL
jgi:hypothetical protein